jgi:hypothetical protein
VNLGLPFRIRGREVTRLEAFSDAVFGFAATLLVVSLEVPRSYDAVLASMRGFIPFALCFAMLIWIWSVHNGFFRRYGMQDAGTTALNGVLLFVVLFFMYPLRFVLTAFTDVILAAAGIISFQDVSVELGSSDERMSNLSVMFALYGVGFAATFGCFALLYRRALRFADQLALDAGERYDARSRMLEHTFFAAIGTVAAILGFTGIGHSVAVGGWIYALIGPVAGAWNYYRGSRRERAIASTGSAPADRLASAG